MKEALKLALDALENHTAIKHPQQIHYRDKAINAIKEALTQPDPYTKGYADAMNWKTANHLEHLPAAQPEQESVAWGVIASNTGKMCQVELDYDEVADINSKWLVPLYTTPPQRTWVGLTDEEMTECIVVTCNTDDGTADTRDLIRAVEAKLKDKNT